MTVEINISDSAREWIESNLIKGPFPTIDEYISALIERDREEKMSEERLEQLLLEGIESGFSVMTPQDWENLHERVQARIQEQNEKCG